MTSENMVYLYVQYIDIEGAQVAKFKLHPGGSKQCDYYQREREIEKLLFQKME